MLFSLNVAGTQAAVITQTIDFSYSGLGPSGALTSPTLFNDVTGASVLYL